MSKDSKFTGHKSMVTQNRKALAVYIIKQNRAQDVPDIMAQLTDLDKIAGDRVPLSLVTDDINWAAALVQDEYLGLKIINILDLPMLPLYRGLSQCLDYFIREKINAPIDILLRVIVRFFKISTEVVQVNLEYSKQRVCIVLVPS